MAGFAPGHLAANPLPPGILGALGLGGYQLLVDVAGVGAGRLGSQMFLVVAPEPAPGVAEGGTQIALHHPRLRDERDAAAFVQLAAQLGYLRLSGYRLALDRQGLVSSVSVVNPATGAITITIPAKHPGKLFGGGANAARLLASVRGLPPAGKPPDLESPELLHQALLALALGDDALDGAQAVEVADRALALVRGGQALDPPAALEAAKRDVG